MTCPETIAIGAYVLGAQDVSERLELERHLLDCASCRDALLRFANLPGLLHTLTLEEVISTEFDPDLEQSLARGPELDWLTPAATPRRTFRGRRALIAAAAAVLVASGGVLIGRGLIDDPAPQAQTAVTWSATDGVGGIDTTAKLSNQSWGTDIQLQMKDLKPGELCKLVVHARSGESETTGWWTTNYIHEADVPASTSIALSDIDRIDVVTAAGSVLTSLTDSTR